MEEMSELQQSYKEVTMNKLQFTHEAPTPPLENPNPPSMVDLEQSIIPFSIEEEERLYAPWRYSVIIKIVGRKLIHQYLKTKLKDIWKTNATFPLIDLGLDFYTAKFDNTKWTTQWLSKEGHGL